MVYILIWHRHLLYKESRFKCNYVTIDYSKTYCDVHITENVFIIIIKSYKSLGDCWCQFFSTKHILILNKRHYDVKVSKCPQKD